MYSPTKLVDSYVISGLPYYDAPLIFDQLKLGSDLTIVPERDNPYDPEALALYSNNNKLGFIPKESNFNNEVPLTFAPASFSTLICEENVFAKLTNSFPGLVCNPVSFTISTVLLFISSILSIIYI